MKNMYRILLLVVLVLASCSKYDDSSLRNDMQNLENRVNALERWQNEVNSNITSLQSIVNSLNGLNHITSVEDLKDSSGKVIGCTLHFAKGESKNIYYGSEGKEGKTPAIGVKIDSDGVYYWTKDGQWLLDEDGNKVRASGTPGNDGANGTNGTDGKDGTDGTDGKDGADGKDGITPKLKIENGYWYVSYDDGTSWSQLGIAETGSTTSACIFKSVTVSDNYITFTLADGSSFALPYGDQLSITFGNTDSHIIAPNSIIDIDYEVQSSTQSVEIEVIGSGDISAEVIADNDTRLKGKIRLTTGSLSSLQSKVVVLVTNGSKVIMRSITFEKETLEITDNSERTLPTSGGEFTIEFLTNVEYDIIISDEAKSWISTGARALRHESITFQAAANNGDGRTGTITIQSKISNQKLVYTIKQEGANTITFGADNGIMPGPGIFTAELLSGNPEKGLSKMFDNDDNTCYEISGKTKANFIWENQEPISIGRYNIKFGNDDSKRPKGMVFYGSNDGNNWDYLIGIGGEPCMPDIDEEFPRQTRYKFIKLEINTTEDRTAMAVSEFRMTAAERVSFNTFDDVVAHGSSFTYTASTPMGTHYENKHVTTEQDKVWLSTATNEPNLLQSAPGYTLRTYEVDLYPFGDPVPADVNQHGIGDCSALAVFASMAYLFPDFIKSIIQDNGNGTYTVDMFDPQGQPVDVTVQSTFLGDNNGIGAASGKKGEATWATILEKAIMKWNYIYEVNPDISGIGSEHVAPLFTGEGNSFAYSPNSLDADQMKQIVELCLEQPMIVIGGFTTGGLPVGSAQTVTAHAYSFFYSNQSNALFAMRNPWGFSPGTSGTEDGVMNITDDGTVPPTIDMRIIYPGKAADFAKTNLSPYIPPQW